MKSWCTTISQFSECCIFYLYHSCFFIFTSNNHLSCTLCIFNSSIVSSINNSSSLFSKPSAFVVCFLTNINVILTFPSVVVFHFWGHATKTQENDDEEKKNREIALPRIQLACCEWVVPWVIECGLRDRKLSRVSKCISHCGRGSPC